MQKMIDPNSEAGQQLHHLYELADQIRGKLLDQAIAIEYIVADIIKWHFCPQEDNRILFFSLIMNRPDLTFSSKIDILEKLLRLRYKDILKEHSELFKELKKIREFRNRIAHTMVDTSEAFLKKGFTDRIQLIFYEKDREKQQVISLQESEERLSSCSQVLLALLSIRDEVEKRALGK